jgi:cytochrome c oxidase assembly factor CtaG
MAMTTPAARRRSAPYFELVSGLIGLAVVALVAFAVMRHLQAPHDPVLPVSWCRADAVLSLPPLLGSALLTRWRADPIADAALAALLVLYLSGTVLARRRSGQAWPLTRSAAFVTGLAVCFLATNSSIAVYDMALFTAHMVGHLMLVMLAPMLLAAGRPLTLLIAATDEPWSRRVRHAAGGRLVALLTAPPLVLASYAAVIVGTHLTGLMDTIMRSSWAGQTEHVVYLAVGFQFFTVVLGGEPIRWQLTTPTRWLLLATAMAVDTFVGLVLLMGNHAVAMVPAPGLIVDTMADTHAGGAIMWVGGDGLMAVLMILLVRDWLTDADRRRADRRGWVEQVRQQVFASETGTEYTGTKEGADPDFDDDDTRLAAYNLYLQRLNAHPGGRQ